MSHSHLLTEPLIPGTLAPSSILSMADVLTWSESDRVLEMVHGSWVTLMQHAMSRFLERVGTVDGSLAAARRGAISRLPPDAFERLLLAPETVFRLLPGRPALPSETVEFLTRSTWAELARSGRPVQVDETCWTALGDGCVHPDGSYEAGEYLEAFMPIDLYSPYSRDIDLTGDEYRLADARPPMSNLDRQTLMVRLASVQRGLQRTSATIHGFVARFTKVLVLQRDDTQSFSSGSNGDFVGRSVIANAHTVTEADIADGIVHESIHALLYMQEEQQPWVLDDSLYQPIPRIISPWSERKLPVRPFLQACFVWYGLLHLWALAGQQGTFDAARARLLFKRAATGFLRGSLTDALAPYRDGLTDDVVAVIGEMQSRVQDALAPC